MRRLRAALHTRESKRECPLLRPLRRSKVRANEQGLSLESQTGSELSGLSNMKWVFRHRHLEADAQADQGLVPQVPFGRSSSRAGTNPRRFRSSSGESMHAVTLQETFTHRESRVWVPPDAFFIWRTKTHLPLEVQKTVSAWRLRDVEHCILTRVETVFITLERGAQRLPGRE